jgi:hypothetical protein
MNYIITAKDVYAGNSIEDAANPLIVTEIATELIITRLYLIMMLQEGIINKNDCIVTIDERKCLYTKIFKNVISYQDFIKKNEKCIDLLHPDIFNKMSSGPVNQRIIPYLPFYQNWERDKHIIKDIEFSSMCDYDLSQSFICLVIRKRSAWTEKNMTNEFWTDLVNKLKKNNIKTFVFGKETENFCDSKTIIHVKNYQDWCTLITNKNCKHVTSTMTGGVYPCLIFGNSNIKMSIIDNTHLMNRYSYDPSFYNDCINFSKIKINYINYIPTTEEIYDTITENL